MRYLITLHNQNAMKYNTTPGSTDLLVGDSAANDPQSAVNELAKETLEDLNIRASYGYCHNDRKFYPVNLK